MGYLLGLTISGGVMTLICLILRRLLKVNIGARMYYLLAKAAVLYYLVPIPFLKRWYRKVLLVILPERQMKIAQIPLTLTNYAVHTEGKLYVNAYVEIQMAAVLVWLAVACLLMAVQFWDHFHTARFIAGYTSTKMTDSQREFLDKLKKRYGIGRHVLLYQGDVGEPSMTFGIYRPVIICGREVGTREAELLTCHELVHIKRLDALWKMLMQIVMLLHWYNPCMWILRSEFNRICEMSCDETVVQGKPKEEEKAYIRLLIEESIDERKTGKPLLRWKSGFGNNERKIRERMNNLMNKKRWSRFAAVALVTTLIFANSMTVFAYRDTYQKEISEEVSQEEIDINMQWDTAVFVPNESGEEAVQDVKLLGEEEILYDRQFTDEEGNIYPIQDGVPYRGCNHVFVSGTEIGHKKNSDGSCDVYKYNAQRCSICGYVIQGSLISTTHYTVCTH